MQFPKNRNIFKQKGYEYLCMIKREKKMLLGASGDSFLTKEKMKN